MKDETNNYKKEFVVRGIKFINMGWATISYFIIAVICLFSLERIYGKFDEKKYEKMSTRELIIEIILYLWVLCIFIYLARNLFPLIPFPFDGYMGYDHMRVKEVVNATVFSIFMFSLNPRIQGYYKILRDRFQKDLK